MPSTDDSPGLPDSWHEPQQAAAAGVSSAVSTTVPSCACPCSN